VHFRIFAVLIKDASGLLAEHDNESRQMKQFFSIELFDDSLGRAFFDSMNPAM
jgi:hypothetical protein